MINIVERMMAQRTEFIEYCSELLSADSLLWVKRVFANINREVSVNGDDRFAVKAWPLYSNVMKFFRDFADSVDPGYILLTVYTCGVELGIVDVGDPIIMSKEFSNVIDVEDFINMCEDDIIRFDMCMNSIIMSRLSDMESDNDINACGLLTLSTLEYLGTCEE